MRILMITPEWPYPLDQGGRIRMFNLLRYLGQRHELHLISVALSPISAAGWAAVQPYCHSQQGVFRPYTPWRRLWRLGISVWQRRPYILSKHNSPTLTQQIQKTVAHLRPDWLLVESQYLAPAVADLDCPRVIDLHDIATDLYFRFAVNPGWSLKKLHGQIQHSWIAQFEAQLPTQTTICTVVSADDQARLRQLSGANNIYVVPNGVDTDYFYPDGTLDVPTDLVFVGSMDYFPNVDAAQYFGQHILPHIWQRRPQTTVTLVGRDPTSAVLALAHDPRITVTGAVADVRPFLRSAALVIIPLRLGGGTRLKLLEAAAVGKAILSTSLGAAGVNLQHAQHLWLADTPENFATACLHLLENPLLRANLGQAARTQVLTQYSWSICISQLEAIWQGDTHAYRY